ncbi:MAG: RlmE family RNA methyltransferase [SAR324 cluster bacterium]|nr:RlmE family RNA methyltransferase [SAR324 cluster bacterium]
MKQIQDHYFYKAKKDGYVARSVYKLQEIDQKYHLLAKRNRVLDLGCSPGSWLQYAAKQVGKKGEVVGIDLSVVSLKLPENVSVVQADIFDYPFQEEFDYPFDVILSDMAPKTTGVKSVDAQRACNLCERALHIASHHLKPAGVLLVKAFQGGPFEQLRRNFQQQYSRVKVYKPKSSRQESVEIFLLGLQKK